MQRITAGKRMLTSILWAAYRVWISRTNWYRYDNLKVRLFPSVFHPGFLFSTKVLLNFIRQLPLKDKKILELGAGSGMISLCLARKGAMVTASDINPEAIQAVKESSVINGLEVCAIESDLYSALDQARFDYIIINPPYYPGVPASPLEYAFYCGEDFDFFRRLFRDIDTHLMPSGQAFMVLSENVSIDKIREIAQENSLDLVLRYHTRIWRESQYIFAIVGSG
ncbi:MAG: methyltransferase [Saprospiraceae bacterium]|nr:methyltransferase [Saprospiraceae bacterium]